MIRVQRVSKSFGRLKALDAVSLDAPAGATLGITGPSGGGKTTLLRLIAGLDAPDSGEVHIDGRCVSRPGHVVEPYRRGIGFVFQRPALWPHMTVAQNVRFGLSDLDRAEADRRLADLLGATDLADLADRRPDELSAGQARRAALVRALAPRPKILLMDEPLTNLDADLKQRLVPLIATAVRQSGATLVYVSHDADEVRQLAQRVVRLEAGRIVEPNEP